MLTFDPEVASTAAEVTALEDSVTMLGDLWLAADLDMRDSNLEMRRQRRRRSVIQAGRDALDADIPSSDKLKTHRETERSPVLSFQI